MQIKVTMNHGCTVHYPNQKHYSTLNKVSEINKEKRSTVKEKQFSQGGHFPHESQYQSIPDNTIVNSHHTYLERLKPLTLSYYPQFVKPKFRNLQRRIPQKKCLKQYLC